MARYRSRRSSRRSASRSAASLLALALPAPIQRVADTRLGPLLMLIGVPSMIVAGLLHVNWNNGLPSVTVDPQAAANVLQKTRDGYNNFENQGGLQDLGNAASNFLHGISNATQGYNPPASYGQSYPTAPARVPSANFPSTQPSTAQRDYRSTITQPTNPYSQQPTYNPQQPTYLQPQTYAQQPPYASPSYNQQAASPSDTRSQTSLQQQQLYQQQQYQYQQQQLYEQQLREQQYRQWLAQQQATATQQPASSPYQQLDAYGRPVSTAYGQPSSNYAQPTAQYGQQNYNQGAVPNANTHGRY